MLVKDSFLFTTLYTDDSTGTHSVYRKLQNYEIMFHVSTYIPYYSKDQQQVERKRHIGNDVVVIIFRDGMKIGLHSFTSLTYLPRH